MQELSGKNLFSALKFKGAGASLGGQAQFGGGAADASVRRVPGQDQLSEFKSLLGKHLKIDLHAPARLPEGQGTRFSSFA